MLLATDSAVYVLDAEAGDAHPRVYLRARGVVRVTEGKQMELVAFADGRLVVLQEGAPCMPTRRVGERVESLLILGEEPFVALVGTEGAHLYRLADGDVRRVAAFDRLPCRERWHTPWGGPPAVRSLAATPDGWVYADIHVGSIIRSGDQGVSWEPAAATLEEDVHQVATCPAAGDRVYANTARAVYLSEDRGHSWQHRGAGLGERYGRAIAVPPAQPDLLLASVSDGPHGDNVHGQLYRSENAGRTWQHVSDGFPDSTYANIDTFHVTFSADGAAWAVVGRDLYAGEDGARRWWKFWTAPEALGMLASRPLSS